MIKKKIGTWLRRYLPAEIICTFTAMIAAATVHSITKNDILTAIAGTWGENAGFYSVMIGRDIYASRKNHKTIGKKYSPMSFVKNIRDLFLEFGPAEVVDSFFSRPFMMYIFPKLTGNIYIGIFAGKIAADIIAYILIIFSFELQRKQKSKKH